ncbi:hypothetical protein DsansV1_C10g0101181 [Dioscorea sansibarensis]
MRHKLLYKGYGACKRAWRWPWNGNQNPATPLSSSYRIEELQKPNPNRFLSSQISTIRPKIDLAEQSRHFYHRIQKAKKQREFREGSSFDFSWSKSSQAPLKRGRAEKGGSFGFEKREKERTKRRREGSFLDFFCWC